MENEYTRVDIFFHLKLDLYDKNNLQINQR